MAIPTTLEAEVARWRDADPDPATRAELDALLAAGDAAALEALFAGRLAFGTAGLRAPLGPGPLRMNRLVVRQTAAGLARHLLAAEPAARDAGVLLAHDARHGSAAFADDCADVIAAHGIPVHRLAGAAPTPLAVFATSRLDAAAGIIVTASHNPPGDNGIKVYGADAAQIVPPADGQIAAAIDAVVTDGRILPSNPSPAQVREASPSLRERYLRAAAARVPAAAAPLRIATTAMHGVGGSLLADLLARGGHADVHPVAAQEEPDPDFPTVSFPNPEEPGVTDLLAARMEQVGADLGLALDPDADRVAVLVPAEDGIRQLTGDEVGALLGDWLLGEVTSGDDRLVAASVVSSTLLARIATEHGAAYFETLTGFKWLCRPALEHPELRQVLAYEEAIGYAIGADVRDKDGITAALAAASMATSHAARGLGLIDALEAIHRRHGLHLTSNSSVRDDAPGGAARRDAAVAAVRSDPPDVLGGAPVRAVDLPADDVVRIDLGPGLRAVIRPSGTEPKLKLYCEAVEPVTDGGLAAARARAAARLARLEADLRALVPGP